MLCLETIFPGITSLRKWLDRGWEMLEFVFHEKKNILKIPEFPIGPFMPGQFKMATSCYSGVQSFYEFEFDLFSTFYIFFDYQYCGLL